MLPVTLVYVVMFLLVGVGNLAIVALIARWAAGRRARS
jgi:hypothetical protein